MGLGDKMGLKSLYFDPEVGAKLGNFCACNIVFAYGFWKAVLNKSILFSPLKNIFQESVWISKNKHLNKLAKKLCV